MLLVRGASVFCLIYEVTISYSIFAKISIAASLGGHLRSCFSFRYRIYRNFIGMEKTQRNFAATYTKRIVIKSF